jgi:hypothetical protein
VAGSNEGARVGFLFFPDFSSLIHFHDFSRP